MKGPKCKLCGKEHWPRQHCEALGGVLGSPNREGEERLPAQAVTPARNAPVTKAHNAEPRVTKSVTPALSMGEPPRGRVAALEAEVELLQGEVARLKRELAQANAKLSGLPLGGERPKAKSAAERMKAMRAKLKAKKVEPLGRQSFEG